jgi:hypothetical protein
MRFGKYQLNIRTGQVEVYRPRHKTVSEIVLDVKRRRGDLIRAHTVSDEELTVLVTKIAGGIRNTQYLAKGDHHRLKDLASFIVREYGW